MRAGYDPNLALELQRPDSRARVYIDAEIEVSSDVRRRRDQWVLADGVVQRAHDFPASSALTAAAQTTALTLANAPAGNDLYEVHYSVQITPVIPGAGTNTHVIEVSIDTRPAAGAWTERARIRYESLRTVGQSGAIVRWPNEKQLVRVAGMTATHEMRLRINSASGPGGWAFVVHGFNVPNNADPTNGVKYHTGLAVDFPDDGGVALADSVKNLVENATSDGYQTDLDGSYANSAASPFLLLRVAFGSDDARDIPIDRIVAFLNPRVDGAQPRNVHLWLMRPYAVTRLGDRTTSSGNAWNQTQVDPTLLSNHLDITAVPLSATMGVFASAGDSPEEVVFSYAHVADDAKPHPKRYVPSVATPASSLGGPVMLVLIWAIQRDGSPATNVGWGQDSTVQQVVSGSRTMRTVQMRILDLNGKWVLESPERGAASRPCYRARIESGNYPATATVAFTGAGAGSRFALATAPTKTVQFICRADLNGGTAVFQVRNDADTGWVTVTDGQTTDDLGLAKNQARKGQVIISATANLDATPVVAEFGMRELETWPLWHCARLQAARWAVDALQLVTETTNAAIEALRDDLAREFRDRVTLLLRKYYIGQITLRAWVGIPGHERWLHVDDFMIDDEEFRGPMATIPALGVNCLERGKLPIYDSAVQTVAPLVYANASIQAVWSDIMSKIGISSRFLGAPPPDASTPVSKVISDSDAKAELDALNFLDGSARITSQGRIKSVRIFGEKSVVRTFSRESIRWVSVTPGFRQRVPEVRVPWNWSDDEQRYRDQAKAAHGNAILRLGKARIDPPLILPDAITRWIVSNSHAEKIGSRHVAAFGAGLMLWYFQTEYLEPQLEPGDCVSVPTDLFAGRDPTSDRELAGDLQAVGVIVEAQEDFRTFGLLIRSYTDIIGAAPESAGLVVVPSGVGIETATYAWSRGRTLASLGIRYTGLAGVASVKIATSTAGYPAPGTGTAVDGQSGTFGAGKFGFGLVVYVTITPYSQAAGAGYQGPEYQFAIPPESLSADFTGYTQNGLSAFNAANVSNLNYTDQAWHTDTAVAGSWLQLDLGVGVTRDFTECRVWVLDIPYNGIYDIEYSDDSISWFTASAGFKPLARGLNSRSWLSVGAHRYWRLKLTNTPGSGGWLSELDFVPANSGGGGGPWIDLPVPMDTGRERAIRTIDDTLVTLRPVALESGGKNVNLLLAKPLAASPDTLDSVNDGSSYKKVGSVSSGNLITTASMADLIAERAKIGATFAQDLAAVSSRTRLQNGGFQDGLIYWNGNPTGVITKNNDADTYKGTYSLKIPHTASQQEYAFQSTEPREPNPLDAHPGNWAYYAVRPSSFIKVDYSCKVSGANVIGRVYVAEYSAAGGLLGTTQIGTDVTSTTWVDRSVTFQVGATTFWVVIRFAAEGTAGGNVWYDEIYFTDLIPASDIEQPLTLTQALKVDGGYGTLPTAANKLAVGGAGSSPHAVSVCWGDNTGWKLEFGTVVAGVFTVLFTLVDNGDLTLTGLTTGPGHACRVFHGSTQSIANNTATACNFDSESYDKGALHDTVTNNTRITAKAAGRYYIAGSVSFDANATGLRRARIRLNGATTIAETEVDNRGAGNLVTLPVACTYDLALNDYVELVAVQTSGGNLNVNAANNSDRHRFEAFRLAIG